MNVLQLSRLPRIAIPAKSLASHATARNNFLDTFSLVLPSPARGELEMQGRGVKACFDGRSDSDDIFNVQTLNNLSCFVLFKHFAVAELPSL